MRGLIFYAPHPNCSSHIGIAGGFEFHPDSVMLIKVKESSADFIAFYRNLSASFSRKIHTVSKQPVPKLPIEKPILLLQIFLRIRPDQHN